MIEKRQQFSQFSMRTDALTASKSAYACSYPSLSCPTVPSSSLLSSCSLIDLLCDDTVVNILSYADFTSALLFARCTSKKMSQRIFGPCKTNKNDKITTNDMKSDNVMSMQNNNSTQQQTQQCSSYTNHQDTFYYYHHDSNTTFQERIPFHRLWKSMYQRANFAPPDQNGFGSQSQITTSHYSGNISGLLLASHEYIMACRYKQSLLQALINVRPRSKHHHHQKNNYLRDRNPSSQMKDEHQQITKSMSCFSLPTRYFYFKPIVPYHFVQQQHPTPTITIHPPIMEQDHTQQTNQQEIQIHGNNTYRDNDDDDDGIPVDFMCTSYALLSPSTSGEYVLLDPFDGTIAIYDNVMNDAFGNDDLFHQELYRNLNELNVSSISPCSSSCCDISGGDDDDDDDNNNDVVVSFTYQANGNTHTANILHNDTGENTGSVTTDQNRRGHNQKKEITPPSEILFSVQDYFNLDLHDYFISHTDNRLERLNERIHDEDDDEVVVDWLGIDTYTMINPLTLDMLGTMICAARYIVMEGIQAEDEKCCTEIVAWKKFNDNPTKMDHHLFGDLKYFCRVDGSPYYIDVNSVQDRVYVAFSPYENTIETPDHINGLGDNEHEEDDDNSMEYDDDTPAVGYNNKIVVFPLLPSSSPEEIIQRDSFGRSFFPSSMEEIECQHPVTCFVTDSTGEKLIIGTANGCIEVRDVSATNIQQKESKCLGKENDIQLVNIGVQLRRMQRTPSIKAQEIAATAHVERVSSSPELVSLSDESISPLDEGIAEASALNHRIIESDDDHSDRCLNVIRPIEDSCLSHEDNDSFTLPQCKPTRKISAITIPRHLPVGQAGFIATQYHKSEGTTLTLWQYKSDGSNKIPSLMSIINLPLSPQRKPEVSYDGKRLIVFGQDHIGLVILVYHVLSTVEDQEASKFKTQYGKDSGGIINLKATNSRVRYVNRIRHAGLGGFDFLDNMYITANERFIVVNTKTGGLINEGIKGTHEGLFVIDLEEGCL